MRCAYDPVLFNYEHIQASSHLNGFGGSIKVLYKGLADKPGRLKMKSSKQESGESFILTSTDHFLNPLITDLHELMLKL